MSRLYKTISNQNMYDVTVQSYGSIDDLDLVMRDTPDLNASIPFETAFILEETDDELGRQLFAGGIKFATGTYLVPEPIVTLGFPYTLPYILS